MGDGTVSDGRCWDVLGVGDADVDLFLATPSLPGHDEKVLGRLLGEFPGGIVANFCHAAARLGARTALATVVGDDAYGGMALAGLRRAGVNLDLTRVKRGGRTYFCVVFLDATGEKALTVVETDCMAPRPDDVDLERFARARLVHLMASNLEDTIRFARAAKTRGALVSLDVEPTTVGADPTRFDELLASVDLVFPNLAGLRRLAAGDELAGARRLLARGPRLVVVTMGAAGCLVVSTDGTARVPAIRVPVVDTTGAGDCFNGAFVAAYLRGWEPARCARFASAAAAIAVQQVGGQTGAPTWVEVEGFLARAEAATAG